MLLSWTAALLKVIYDIHKNGQQMTHPRPPFAKINNRPIIQNNGIRKHVTNFKNLLPTPFCVDIINVCFLSGFLKFGLSHVWMEMNFLWNFMKIQSSYLLSSYQRNQTSLYFQLYQLLFLYYMFFIFSFASKFWNTIMDSLKKFCLRNTKI